MATLYKFSIGTWESSEYPKANWINPFKSWLLDKVLSGDIKPAVAKIAVEIFVKYLGQGVNDITLFLDDGTKVSVEGTEEEQ